MVAPAVDSPLGFSCLFAWRCEGGLGPDGVQQVRLSHLPVGFFTPAEREIPGQTSTINSPARGSRPLVAPERSPRDPMADQSTLTPSLTAPPSPHFDRDENATRFCPKYCEGRHQLLAASFCILSCSIQTNAEMHSSTWRQLVNSPSISLTDKQHVGCGSVQRKYVGFIL